jgi:hypothetical protein
MHNIVLLLRGLATDRSELSEAKCRLAEVVSFFHALSNELKMQNPVGIAHQ